MKRLLSIAAAVLALSVIPALLEATESSRIRHDLKVAIYPNEHRFTVIDSVTVPESLLTETLFLLHRGLEPSSSTPGVSIVRVTGEHKDNLFESFKVKLPPGLNTFEVEYGGSIYHPVKPYGKEQARGFMQTPGIISEEGVYLAGSSYWYPRFEDKLITFNLQVELPPGWDAVSQGERVLHLQKKDINYVQWRSPELQDEIFIIAGRFKEYIQPAGNVLAMVFLQKPDKELADKYLDATVRYLAMYERLIGPYPYKKFALVENFWETGFGMPSFTLLGPKVIRFPFILQSSYPHEILHNWWGNSVFPDYMKGNWSEGLTAYLSDHLIKEQEGSGAEYRQATLQRYADYVLSEQDFPLTEFHTRYSSPSEAVGYGKSLMFFHMLRQELGDKNFIAGLREFYRDNQFNFVSFNELKKSFEKVSGKDLRFVFDQWVTRTGAPKFKLSSAKAKAEGDGYVLTVLIKQIQTDDAYLMRIPIAVTMEGQERAYQTMAVMDKKTLELKLCLRSKPLRIDVDPEFDLFRRLDRDEIPPALSQALGAKKMLVLLPSSANETLIQAYRDLSKVLSNSGPEGVEVRFDKEMGSIPSDRAVAILGWENRFLGDIISALSGYDVVINKKDVQIGKIVIPHDNHSVILSARNPKNKDMALTLIATDLPEAIQSLGRKLPHYHKYSYLGFEGVESDNIAKGRWPVVCSPMTAFLPDKNGKVSKIEMGELSLREPLATLPPAFSKELMMETISFLSSEEIMGRGFDTEGLNRAAEFIAGKFQEAGLKPAGNAEGSYFQIWEDIGGNPEHKVTMKNVIGVIPGKNPRLSDQIIIVGAHYDHLGLGWPDTIRESKGKIYPGADDNASGVAVLIELARVLANVMNPDRSILFIAFTGEEAGKKGSKYYIANQRRYPIEKSIGMLNLDIVGRLGKKKLLILGADSAREWMHIFKEASFVTGVDMEIVSEEQDSSDQVSFREAGVTAVQLFTGPHSDYHRPTDTVDKIDPEGLVKVASVTKEVIEYLSSREFPITTMITHGKFLSLSRKWREK